MENDLGFMDMDTDNPTDEEDPLQLSRTYETAAITIGFGDRRLHISMQCCTIINLDMGATFVINCGLRGMWNRPRAKWYRSFATSFPNPMRNVSSCGIAVGVICLSERYHHFQDWIASNIHPSHFCYIWMRSQRAWFHHDYRLCSWDVIDMRDT